RMGGPDFSAASGNTHIASHGVVASTFVLGGPAPGAGPPPAAGRPIPTSLRAVVPAAVTTCSMSAPCLFFQTSRDDGRTWRRHYVPVTSGFQANLFTYIAAD